jgi:hypothetical protein
LPVEAALQSTSLSGREILTRVISRVTSMQPALVREPFHRPGWVFEEKYDG